MGRVLNTIRVSSRALGVVVLTAGAVACGSEAADSSADDESGGSADRPQIVVTTNILGDVVAAAVGAQADVEVIMPLGSDPHDFAPSARQAESMENADLLVINGAGFEEGMLDIIANVSDTGTQVFSFAEQIDLLEFTGHDDHSDEEHSDDDHSDDDHSDEEHADEEHGDDEHSEDDEDKHSDEEGDEHSDEEHSDDGEDKHSDEEDGEHSDEDGDEHAHEEGDDPHIWTDPTRIATAVEAMEPAVAGLAGVDADALSTSIAAYVAELSALDTAMDTTLTSVPADQRVLVTNHEVFGYFADRYDFEIVGAIVPSLTTNAEPSASDIDELAELIDEENIQAVFGETTQSTQLADALADEVGGDVVVVELFSETLGEEGSGAETYLGMMQSNADLIAEALTP